MNERNIRVLEFPKILEMLAALAVTEPGREAARALNAWRLTGCTLYVTLEPCCMCAGAIMQARVERVVFGAYDAKAGSCGSVVDLFSLPYNHKPELKGGVLESECAQILSDFFKALRAQKRAEV